MSNSIWHKRDETPKDFCDVVLSDFRTGSCCVFLSPFHNVSFDYDRWAYLTDIIAQANKAERLQKAVEYAKDALDVISLKYHKTTPSIFLIKYAEHALEKITALEQKDNK